MSFRGILQQRPMVAVGLAITRGHDILLYKRKEKHASGFWSCPGGHVEMYEDLVDALKREVLEECGVEIRYTEPKFWTIANTVYKDEGKHYVVILYKSKWISGEAKAMEPEKNDGWHWINWYVPYGPLIQGLKIAQLNGDNPF